MSGKKRKKGKGKSKKVEESEKRKERKGQRKIEKRNAVNGLVSLLALGHATRSNIVENEMMIDKNFLLEAMQFSLLSKIHQNLIIANL